MNRKLKLIWFRKSGYGEEFDAVHFTSLTTHYGNLRDDIDIFIFDILRLPLDLLLIWKGGPVQGYDFPIEFQHHVASTYFDSYAKYLEDPEGYDEV